MESTKKVTVSLDPMMYWAVKDLVKQRKYPSISFAVESLVREGLRNQAMVPYGKHAEAEGPKGDTIG